MTAAGVCRCSKSSRGRNAKPAFPRGKHGKLAEGRKKETLFIALPVLHSKIFTHVFYFRRIIYSSIYQITYECAADLALDEHM